MTIGRNNKTPPQLIQGAEVFCEHMQEGFQYEDSKHQTLLWENEAFTSQKEQLLQTYTPYGHKDGESTYPYPIFSKEQIYLLLHLPPYLMNELKNASSEEFTTYLLQACYIGNPGLLENTLRILVDFKYDSLELFKSLINDKSRKHYQMRISVLNILEMDINKSDKNDYLISDQALVFYQENLISFNEFKTFNYSAIKALTSENMDLFFRRKKLCFHEIKNLNPDVLKLISLNVSHTPLKQITALREVVLKSSLEDLLLMISPNCFNPPKINDSISCLRFSGTIFIMSFL